MMLVQVITHLRLQRCFSIHKMISPQASLPLGTIHLTRAFILEQEEVQSTSKPATVADVNKLKKSSSDVDNSSEEVQKTSMGARATDSARVMKFTKVLSGSTVILGI